MVAQFLLIEWSPSANGFEMTRFLPTHAPYPVTGWQPPAGVAGDQVVLLTADPNDGDDVPALPWDTDGWFLSWHDLAAEDGGGIELPAGDYLVSLDPATGAAIICRAQRDPARLACDRWTPGAPEPSGLLAVDGIRSVKFVEIDLETGRVYVFGKDNVLYVADIGELRAGGTP